MGEGLGKSDFLIPTFSADFGCVHGFKSFGNASEVKAHATQSMPEMTLQEEECKVEVGVGKPGPSSVGVVCQSNSVTEVRREGKLQLECLAIQLSGVNRGVLCAPDAGNKTHQSNAGQ